MVALGCPIQVGPMEGNDSEVLSCSCNITILMSLLTLLIDTHWTLTLLGL